MRSWPLQAARSQFRALFDAALGDGPQRVTRHGRQAVVVVSETEWQRLKAARDGGFGEFLTSCPLEDGDLPLRRPARVLRDPPF